jgi:hypothetical protein
MAVVKARMHIKICKIIRLPHLTQLFVSAAQDEGLRKGSSQTRLKLAKAEKFKK